MAQHHVHEISVFERRLRPIYDSLEAGNNKKALNESEKLLKKNPQFACARALKALALLRLGRGQESTSILDALSDEKPCDDATLQVLTFCFKEMEQLEKICELYFHAAKQLPGNEEIMAHLFMSYVRLNDFKAQQATALQLYKLKPKNPYYFWAVMSVVLQALRGSESKNFEKRKMYLELAQKMVDKLLKEDKLDAEQEVYLYINILEEQQKYKEALIFYEGPVCKKLFPGAPISIKIELFKKMSMWQELYILLEGLLREQRDRWDYYKEYLTACFEIYATSSKDVSCNNVMDSCHEFLCQLIEIGKKIRGPYLARIELYKRMQDKNLNPAGLLGDLSELLLEYFRNFGEKKCCTKDIALFLKCLKVEQRNELSSKFLRDTGITSTILPNSKEKMQKHICSLQISRMCGSHLELKKEHLLALFTNLKLHYEHGFRAYDNNLLQTDIGYSDSYALLAGHIMYDISIKEQKSDYLLDALCLLNYVLKNSPSSLHAKLLCLKIYHFLGCSLGAHYIYETLDIKHIQLDSMGYLHCAILPSSGLINQTKNVYDATLKFFTTSYKERLEYITMSYKYGSFSKLLELMNFRDRLLNSFHYAMISTEELLLELVCLSGTISQNLNTYKLMSIQPESDRIQWNDLVDNRDLSVVVRWDPVDYEENEKTYFEQEIDLLNVRSCLLRLISSFIENVYPSNSNDKNLDLNVTTLVEILKHTWENLFINIELKNYKKPSKTYLVNCLASRLFIMLEISYKQFFSDLAQFILDLNVAKSLKIEICDKLNENVTTLRILCKNYITLSNESIDNIWTRKETVEKIFAVIEIFSLYSFILSVYHEKFSTLPHQQAKKNRKKEGKLDASSEKRLILIVHLMKHIKQELRNLSNLIDEWTGPNFKSCLVNCFADMSLEVTIQSELVADLKKTFSENHQIILTNFRNILKDKIRMSNKQ